MSSLSMMPTTTTTTTTMMKKNRRRHPEDSYSSSFWHTATTTITRSTTTVVIVVAGLSISLLVAVLGLIAADDATLRAEAAAGGDGDFYRQLQEGDQQEASSLAVNVTFEDILKTVVFLLATWGSANICRVIGLPSLAGEIVVGMVLGPPVLDFCPYPEAMVLIGNFGLIGLILNSGIDLDIAQLRETGTRAVMIAVSGTTLALSSGIGVSYIMSTETIQSAFSIGAIFAPSSWGVASQVLSKGEILNTPTGQTIMASSVVDDILGLILLSILEVFVMPDPSSFDYVKPFLASFGYLIVLGGLGITVIPRMIENHILPKFPPDKRDFAAIALMFCLMTAYLPLMYFSGASFLTGAFLAGVSFSQLNHVHATFANSSHEVMVWLMRMFFAATIGFQIPATYFSDPKVLKKGAIFCKLNHFWCFPPKRVLSSNEYFYVCIS
jgi:Kef-type K+ transport system membrane component KefB